jgi:hypothetical protein
MDVKLEKGAFRNGFGHFCPECLCFFSVSGDYSSGAACRCPFCGADGLITGWRGLAAFCQDAGIDTAEYWEAFPPGSPLPGSRCAATPRQIRKLCWAAAEGLREGRLSSTDSLCRETGIGKETVQAAVNAGALRHECLERGFVERRGPGSRRRPAGRGAPQ